MVVSWVYAYAKINQAVHLKCVYFIICKFYINLKNKNK